MLAASEFSGAQQAQKRSEGGPVGQKEGTPRGDRHLIVTHIYYISPAPCVLFCRGMARIRYWRWDLLADPVIPIGPVGPNSLLNS